MSLYGLVHKLVICRKCFMDVEAHEKCFLDEQTAFNLSLRQEKSSKIEKIQMKIVETCNDLHDFRVHAQSCQQISLNVHPCTIMGEWERQNERCAWWLQLVKAQPKGPLEMEAAEELEAREVSEEARQAVMDYRSEIAVAPPQQKTKEVVKYLNSVEKITKAVKEEMKLEAEKPSGEVLSGSKKSAEPKASSSKRTSRNYKFSKAKETPCTSYTKILSREERSGESSKNIPENRHVPKEEIKQGVRKTYAEVLAGPKKSAG
ncbi:hypothetical protein OCU04_002995 [Sclerotinia nivalis]|uniref:Uncharacterized protein n=1 Tax=Sclerotinia nivalis TaxID=352851 RepID=A0A9X0AV95_9HELO|nr:hypothetical protein OCU04_002995 [Sclerotinia nivalis]